MPFRTIMDVQDLAAHLEDPDWVIADCRFDLDDTQAGADFYLEAHIPGAVYVHLDHQLSARPAPELGRHPLPALEDLTATFSQMGIGPSTQVVAYDLPFAARLWWLLRYTGHEAVAILDGGIGAWIQAGYPTSSGKEHHSPARYIPNVQSDMIIDMDTILSSLETPGEIQLIDSRSPERFRGEKEPRDPVAARIPGASNYFWGNNLGSNGSLKPAREIQASLLDAMHGNRIENTAVYCGSGVTAAVNVLAFEYSGMGTVRLYPGSWSQWCSDPARPIERG